MSVIHNSQLKEVERSFETRKIPNVHREWINMKKNGYFAALHAENNMQYESCTAHLFGKTVYNVVRVGDHLHCKRGVYLYSFKMNRSL